MPQNLENLEQELINSVTRIKRLEKRIGDTFTPDGFLRTEFLPQLAGDVTHSAGSEVVTVPKDRWEYRHNIEVSVDLSVQQTTNILNSTGETGRLINLFFYVNANVIKAGASECSIEITIDGGVTQTIHLYQVNFYNSETTPLQTTNAPHTLSMSDDSIVIPFHLNYEDSCVIDFNVSTAFTSGSITFIVNSAVLSSLA